MAKRKRLTPAQTDFLARPSETGQPRAFAAPPIAGMAGDAARSAAATELAETLTRARDQGLMVLELPLDAVDAGYLVRDRLGTDEAEMQVLMSSIAACGQRTPVEVADLGGGRYGLISGWRRLEALRRLGPEGGPDTILALLRQPHDAGDAYLAMVEENEIRAGLSYYERARIVRKAVEQEAYPDVGSALRALFHAASRAKRSKIGSFLVLVESLDEVLAFPEALGERAGLQLVKALEDDPTMVDRLRRALAAARPQDAAAELAVIEKMVHVPKSGRARSGNGPRPASRAAAGGSDPLPLGPGLAYRETEAGEVVLSGPALTRDLRERLIDWLMLGPVDRP